MKTVLVVSYHYPPEEGSCSEKNVRIVKELLDNGFQVVVLTKGYIGYPNVAYEKNTTVIRTEHNGIFHRISNKEPEVKEKHTRVNVKRSEIKTYISNAIIPDSVVDWVPEVKKTYCSKKELFSKCEIILSISSPYSAHLASEYLSEMISVPYIMCYGDPWIYEPKRQRGKIRYLIEKKIEGRLLHKAKKVLLITQWNKERYKTIYKLNDEKIYTYNIGYDQSECLSNIKRFDSTDFTIIYGGSLDPVHRDPEPFLKAMTAVSGIHAYIYNSDNPNIVNLIKKYHIHDKVSVFPIIGSKDFYKKLYEMDALLLFGNKTPFQVPGKIFTYISTKKKIIYIKNNKFADDGSEQILKNYGYSISVQNNAKEIAHCLTELKECHNDISNNRAEEYEFHKTMFPIIEAVQSTLEEKR